MKELLGNPGRRPLNKNEVKPKALIARPAHITGKVAEEWDRVIAAMPPGFFAEADVPVLSIYCEALTMRRNALAIVAKDGLVVEGSQGQDVAHPMIAVAARQAEIILKAADRLGMSPAARTRLNGPSEDPEDDEEDRFFTRPH